MAKLELEAHRIAAQALGQQEQALTELRTRTGTLLTAGISVVLCIYVLLPKDGLIFALDAPEAYGALYDVRADDGEVDRRLAYWL